MRRGIIRLNNDVRIIAGAAVGGRREGEGPIGQKFDFIDPEDRFGKDKWEQSEAEMQALALNFALNKCAMHEDSLDFLLAGDLINQCTSSGYGLRYFDVPFLGIYGACSTSSEGILLASLLLDGGKGDCAAVVSSSHFCSAERQFRSPVEYGGQRPPTSQWTATAAGAFILKRDGSSSTAVTEVLPGIVQNGGIRDPNNMGAAMAPAALDTLTRYFGQSCRKPEEFDLILTGDLGNEGTKILLELSEQQGLSLYGRHADCGLMIFDRTKQDVHSGGSGCGCAASVLAAEILPKIELGDYRNVLFAATGALLSSDSVKQGQSIPGISHLVHLEHR